MSEGTPLDALESGSDIPNATSAADAARMEEIMRDLNGSSGMQQETPQSMNMPPVSAPPMRHAPPPQRSVAPSPQYMPMEEEYRPPRRKNFWGSVTAKLRDPILVSVIVFVLSLPILHTHLAKYAGWAFAVGGQLSWIGLVLLSLLAGILFGLSSGVANLVGL